MDLHHLAEERSLAYHAAVARRLLADPSIVEKARSRVAEWQRSGSVNAFYANEWRKLLSRSPDEIGSAILARDEQTRALRQVTPFAGVLTPRERWSIWRDVRRSLERAE